MWLLKANFLFDFDPFWNVSLHNNEFRKSSLISSFYVSSLVIYERFLENGATNLNEKHQQFN